MIRNDGRINCAKVFPCSCCHEHQAASFLIFLIPLWASEYKILNSSRGKWSSLLYEIAAQSNFTNLNRLEEINLIDRGNKNRRSSLKLKVSGTLRAKFTLLSPLSNTNARLVLLNRCILSKDTMNIAMNKYS